MVCNFEYFFINQEVLACSIFQFQRYMLVLNKYPTYAVGLLLSKTPDYEHEGPHTDQYGIISNTIAKYDTLVTIGAFLEVALDEIIKEKNGVYSQNAKYILPVENLVSKIFPFDSEGRFVFCVSNRLHSI
jgi:hypothetical protein